MNTQHRTLKARGVVTLIATVVAAVLGFRPAGAAAHDGSEGAEREPIVGLWQGTFKDASTGTVVVQNWDVWNSDRTETENDSGRTSMVMCARVPGCRSANAPTGSRIRISFSRIRITDNLIRNLAGLKIMRASSLARVALSWSASRWVRAATITRAPLSQNAW
jgi:hypothetical protein